MTGKDVKRYLSSYRECDREIARKVDELGRLRDRVQKLTPTLSGLPGGSGSSDVVGDTVAKIVDLEREIDNDIDRLLDIRRNIEAAIGSVNNERDKTLLRLRYIDGWTQEQTAERLGLSTRHIKRIETKIINFFAKCPVMSP